MAMVGLFWITGGDVHVGAKPSGLGPGVRLSSEGVVALGDGQAGLHRWADVRALTVTDVPVRTLMRQVGTVTDVALSTVVSFFQPMSSSAADDAPALMTVRARTDGGDHELSVHTAAAVGYSRSEVDLSLALLTRLTGDAEARTTTLAAMSEWGRTWEDGSPRAAEREGLLREWTGRGGSAASAGNREDGDAV